jgi:hypothetical protein
MPETLPDPSLPLFPEKMVSYTVVHKPQEGRLVGETVQLPVDEIDAVENPKLRDVLWKQFRTNEEQESFAIFPFVRSDGSFSHAISVPRRPIGVTFTEDGVIENAGLPAYRETKSQERLAKEQKTGNWLCRLLKR